MSTKIAGTVAGRRRVTAWKTPDISADFLKNFACFVMLIQTIGITVIEKGIIHLDAYTQAGLSQAMAEDSRLMFMAGLGSVMQLVGGLGMPVFVFNGGGCPGQRNSVRYGYGREICRLDQPECHDIYVYLPLNAAFFADVSGAEGHWKLYGEVCGCAWRCTLGDAAPGTVWAVPRAPYSRLLPVPCEKCVEDGTWDYCKPVICDGTVGILSDWVL